MQFFASIFFKIAFYVNDDCENILKEDTVILFEILDFNPKQLAARELNN